MLRYVDNGGIGDNFLIWERWNEESEIILSSMKDMQMHQLVMSYNQGSYDSKESQLILLLEYIIRWDYFGIFPFENYSYIWFRLTGYMVTSKNVEIWINGSVTIIPLQYFAEKDSFRVNGDYMVSKKFLIFLIEQWKKRK